MDIMRVNEIYQNKLRQMRWYSEVEAELRLHDTFIIEERESDNFTFLKLTDRKDKTKVYTVLLYKELNSTLPTKLYNFVFGSEKELLECFWKRFLTKFDELTPEFKIGDRVTLIEYDTKKTLKVVGVYDRRFEIEYLLSDNKVYKEDELTMFFDNLPMWNIRK